MLEHEHAWSVVDRWAGYEIWSCHCGDFKKVHVKE